MTHLTLFYFYGNYFIFRVIEEMACFTYTYNRADIEETLVLVDEEIKDTITYRTEKAVAKVYDSDNKVVGFITFINNLIFKEGLGRQNTSTGTLVTTSGTVVFNLSYVLSDQNSVPPPTLFLTQPTFVSGGFGHDAGNIDIRIKIKSPRGLRKITVHKKGDDYSSS